MYSQVKYCPRRYAHILYTILDYKVRTIIDTGNNGKRKLFSMRVAIEKPTSRKPVVSYQQ